jgi:arylsulfatase A-like enzyme
MNRVAAFLLVALAPWVAGGQPFPFTNAPNVMVILFDDMGFSDLGCYGGEARTPNIDNLAAHGLRFRNFHNTARCSPTRMSLLTGLYTHQAATVPGDSLPPMRTDNNIILAEVLRTLGYRTYMAGKWHLGSSSGQTPRERGFQHVFGMGSTQSGSGADFWKRDAYSFSSQGNEIPARTYGTNAYDFHLTDAMGDYAVDFLNHHFSKADGGRFFMYLPFHAPHFDIEVNKALAEFTPAGGQSYLSLYTQGWDIVRSNRYQRMLSAGILSPLYLLSPMSDSPYNGTPAYQPVPAWRTLAADRKADLARRMALYSSMIEQVDQNVGRIISRLSAGGQLDNTLIFILSDNGGNAEGGMYGWARTGTEANKSNNHAALTGTDLAEMGQPFRQDNLSIGGGWANVANTPFRMYKRYSHEGGIRTPLIVHWPVGLTNSGRWTDQAGHLIDLMRTVVDVTGAAYPTQYNGHAVWPMEGKSLAPIFRQEPEFSRTIGFEHESTRAWLDGQWKLVTKTAASTDWSSLADTLELYNTAADPTELNNLAPYQPARLVAMVDAWNAWANRVGVPADRLLPSAFNPTPAAQGADLFLDTFSRPDSVDVDASAAGMSGSRVPPLGAGAAYYEGYEGSGTSDSIHIFSGRMRIAYGLGMAENGLMHNFIGQDIIDAGGFSVSMRIRAIETATGDPSNRYVGFGVGLTQAEAAAGSDISKANSFRGSEANPIGKADFFVELDINGNVKVWKKGQLQDTVPVGTTNGTLTATFALTGFTTTSTVTVNVFFNGRQLDINSGSTSSLSRTFTWDNNNANYIGLSARATSYAEIDNLAIRKLPLAPALASEYALSAGLTVPDSDLAADPDGDGSNNFEEWLKGGNPAAKDSSRQLLAVSPAAGGEFRFNYYRLTQAGPAGVSYAFRYSTNLTSWTAFTPEELSSQADGPGYERVTCRVPVGLTTGQRGLFVLLEARGPAP